MWMATLKDVARAAGVSLTTASYALNGKGAISESTRRRVQETARRLGYRRPLRSTGAIVAIVAYPGASCVRSLRQAAAEYGYELQEFTWSRNSSEAPDLVATFGKVAGVVVHGGLWRREFLRAVAEAHPTVLLGGSLPTVPSDTIWIDSAGSVYSAVNYLYSLGHRRFGLVNGPEGSPVSWDKSLGFARALKDFSEDCSGIGISTLDFSPGEGERVAKEIWERDPAVTAMIAGDPVYVDGIMAEARRRGLSIPHDVSVVALGDAPLLSLMKPSVSAIPVPELDIAREAIAHLLRRIERPTSPRRRILIQSAMIHRESVSSPAPRSQGRWWESPFPCQPDEVYNN